MTDFPKPANSPQRPKVPWEEISLVLSTHLHPTHQSDPLIIKFIKEYLHCRSIGQASKECGISTRQGTSLIRRKDIYDSIKAISELAMFKNNFDPGELVQRVKEIVEFDPIELENSDGSFKEKLSQMAPESRRAIKKLKCKNLYETDPNGMKVLAGRIVEYEFWDKLRAVELLGREHDLFKETKRIEHDITKNMADTLLESKKRAETHIRDVEAIQIGDREPKDE